MLVLTRSRNQTIRVGDDIVIRIVAIAGGQVRLGVDAPKHVSVDREEIYLQKQQSPSPPPPRRR